LNQADNYRKVAKLMVGPYYINILDDGVASYAFKLPASAELFASHEVTETGADFTFIISADSLPDAYDDCIDSVSAGPSPYKICRLGQKELLWLRYNNRDEVKLAYIISEDWSRWRLIADNSGTYGIDSFFELSYIFAYSVIKKAGLMLHGVVMEWDGMGIIVCAHSGVGKSTHTSMWESREQARIINGDKALCYKEGNAWHSCGAPWCGSSGKFINKKVPIKALVLLERGEKNNVMRISALQGAMSLIGLTYAPGWSDGLMNSALDLLDDLVKKVPVYRLCCRPDYEAVKVLKQEIQKLKWIGGINGAQIKKILNP